MPLKTAHMSAAKSIEGIYQQATQLMRRHREVLREQTISSNLAVHRLSLNPYQPQSDPTSHTSTPAVPLWAAI